MLTIKNTEVFGLHRALQASGNPMSTNEINTQTNNKEYPIERGKKLGTTSIGSGHDHFLLGIHVQFDILYPQYWTIEAERYHNFEIISSQSKMHRLTFLGKEDTFFSMFNKYVDTDIIEKVKKYIQYYNEEQNKEKKYQWFMKALSNLPMGFEMWMTCDLTYLQLKTMYFQRKNHKLKEDWGEFCIWCESLPLFKELIIK